MDWQPKHETPNRNKLAQVLTQQQAGAGGGGDSDFAGDDLLDSNGVGLLDSNGNELESTVTA